MLTLLTAPGRVSRVVRRSAKSQQHTTTKRSRNDLLNGDANMKKRHGNGRGVCTHFACCPLCRQFQYGMHGRSSYNVISGSFQEGDSARQISRDKCMHSLLLKELICHTLSDNNYYTVRYTNWQTNRVRGQCHRVAS